jgi:hypothetical protein
MHGVANARPQARPIPCGVRSGRGTEWEFPCRVGGHVMRAWFETKDRIRGFVDRLYAARGLAPQRFRTWAGLGDGERLAGEWLARADLPTWEPGIGEAQLRARFGESA